MKWFWLGTSGMALVTLMVLLFSGKTLSPEDQIKKVIADGVTALEAADVKGATTLLHEDYKDEGGRTKDALKGVTFMALRRGPLVVGLTKVDVTVSGDTASAVVQGVALQGHAEVKVARDLLPQRGRAFDATLAFRRVDDETWRVTAIDGISAAFLD